jgi:succinyl-CoA synthetase beta subunit
VKLKADKAVELLARHDIRNVGESPGTEPAGELMVTVDPASHKIMFLLSKRQFDHWGELAARSPRDVSRDFLEPGEAAHGHIGRELARRAGFGGGDHARLEKLVLAAHRIFTETESIWVRLRLLRIREGLAVCGAEVEVDPDALFRHPDLQDSVEEPQTRELTEREEKARAEGISYVDLDGDLGILPGGIGFGMAAVDIVHNIGGAAANVMDSGGEATPERLRAMMDLLLDNPRTAVAFCCRYAGLTRADEWAKMMVRYLMDKRPAKPVVLRVAGNNEDEARRIFEEAAQAAPEVFKKIWTFYSTTPADNAAREAVALAEMIRKGEDPFANGSEGAEGSAGAPGSNGPARPEPAAPVKHASQNGAGKANGAGGARDARRSDGGA